MYMSIFKCTYIHVYLSGTPHDQDLTTIQDAALAASTRLRQKPYGRNPEVLFFCLTVFFFRRNCVTEKKHACRVTRIIKESVSLPHIS